MGSGSSTAKTTARPVKFGNVGDIGALKAVAYCGIRTSAGAPPLLLAVDENKIDQYNALTGTIAN
jgi:hypothetical protein